MIKTKKEILKKIDEQNELLKKQNELLEQIVTSALGLSQRKQQNNYFYKNKNQNEQKIENKKEFQFYKSQAHTYDVRNHNNYITTQDASKKWNIQAATVSLLCKQGRVQGAIKAPNGHSWLIPANAKKPRDRRHKLVIACKKCGWVIDSEKTNGTRYCKCGNIGMIADDNGSKIIGNEDFVKPIFNFWKDKHFIKNSKTIIQE